MTLPLAPLQTSRQTLNYSQEVCCPTIVDMFEAPATPRRDCAFQIQKHGREAGLVEQSPRPIRWAEGNPPNHSLLFQDDEEGWRLWI